MDDSTKLDSLRNRAVYAEYFMDPDLWLPYVQRVCAWHGFSCTHVKPGLPGTFPTFIVEVKQQHPVHSSQKIVVKFFGPLFDGAASFLMERDIGRWLETHSMPLPSPKILADGQLTAEWQYLFFEHITGVSIGQEKEKLSGTEWLSIARQMGTYMRSLHAQTSVNQSALFPSIQPNLEKFSNFIRQQRADCQAHHREWNDLPAQLVDQIEGFILPLEQLVDFSAPAHLIHADLTMDHLLGGTGSAGWESRAIIDWGDAMTGNILYELVALHLDLFQADKHLLKVCLDEYGLSDFYHIDFPRKAFSMVLLHQFPMPARFYTPFHGVHSLQALADGLFAV